MIPRSVSILTNALLRTAVIKMPIVLILTLAMNVGVEKAFLETVCLVSRAAVLVLTVRKIKSVSHPQPSIVSA